MAFIKEIEVSQDTGVTGEYWKTAQVAPDAEGSNMLVVMAIYKNKIARQAGKKPIDHRVFNIPKAELTATSLSESVTSPTGKQCRDIFWKWIYLMLKKSRIVDDNETSFFVDAVDD